MKIFSLPILVVLSWVEEAAAWSNHNIVHQAQARVLYLLQRLINQASGNCILEGWLIGITWKIEEHVLVISDKFIYSASTSITFKSPLKGMSVYSVQRKELEKRKEKNAVR